MQCIAIIKYYNVLCNVVSNEANDMTTTKMENLTKTGGFTVNQLSNTEIVNGFQAINKSASGVEIIDRRDLRSRLYNPIKGRGVKLTFGVTHFVVTEKYYSQLIKK
jgi:hypothetical protein